MIPTVALASSESVLSKSAHTVGSAIVSQRSKPNVLLVAFDALDAQEMLLYGILAKNRACKPLTHGTVGVVDGRYQYVLDLHKGALGPWNKAQIWNLDWSAENPAKPEQLLPAIDSRLPELRQKSK